MTVEELILKLEEFEMQKPVHVAADSEGNKVTSIDIVTLEDIDNESDAVVIWPV